MNWLRLIRMRYDSDEATYGCFFGLDWLAYRDQIKKQFDSVRESRNERMNGRLNLSQVLHIRCSRHGVGGSFWCAILLLIDGSIGLFFMTSGRGV